MKPNNRRRRNILIAAAVVITGMLFTGGAAWWMGGRLTRPANRPVGPPPPQWQATTLEPASLNGATQIGSIACWQRFRDDAWGTVLLLHPIRADRRAMLDRANLLNEAGLNTVMIDLPAHGESPGDQIGLGFTESAGVAAAIKHCRRSAPNVPLGLLGWSLGGAASCYTDLADVDALVLECVYSSVTQATHNRIQQRLGPAHHILAPLLLWQLRPRLGVSPKQLRPVDRLATLRCPLLILAGALDEHTTLAETKLMYEAAQEPKLLMVFPQAAHEDLFRSAPQQYRDVLIPFLRQHLSR